MERKNENLTAIQGPDTNNKQRANQSKKNQEKERKIK